MELAFYIPPENSTEELISRIDVIAEMKQQKRESLLSTELTNQTAKRSLWTRFSEALLVEQRVKSDGSGNRNHQERHL